jgi:hypothetical protein
MYWGHGNEICGIRCNLIDEVGMVDDLFTYLDHDIEPMIYEGKKICCCQWYEDGYSFNIYSNYDGCVEIVKDEHDLYERIAESVSKEIDIGMEDVAIPILTAKTND